MSTVGAGARCGTGAGAGADAGALACACCPSTAGGDPASACRTSPLVTRPPRPVPAMAAVSTFFSAASFCAAGMACPPPAGALRAAAALDACCAAAFGASAPGGCPAGFAASVSICAMTSLLATVLASPLMIFTSTPEPGAGVSSTTLSVSMSTRFSSRLTYCPACLCQLSSVASATDSESCGTFTSISMRSSSRSAARSCSGSTNLAFRRKRVGDEGGLLATSQ